MACDCCKKCIGCCIKWINNPYFCILISGIVYGVAISSLYTWMSNVNEVEVAPPTNKYSIFSSENDVNSDGAFQNKGIMCLPSGVSGDQTYCNHITEQMINITIMNSSKTVWQCGLFTDYSHKSLYDDIPFFRTMLIAFIICTVLSAIFSIIHDWTLVYYRKQLHKLISYPHDDDSMVYSISAICQPILRALENHCICAVFFCICTVFLIVPLCVLILLFLQFVVIMVFYPFYVLIMRQSLYGFSYVSSTWVGLSTGLMMFFSVTLLISIWPFERDVPSLDPDHCTCGCNYMLTRQDLSGFFVVAFGLVLANAKFLYYWYAESKHGEQFLYLVKYILPLFRATNINKDNNPVGSMFGRKSHYVHIMMDDREVNVNSSMADSGIPRDVEETDDQNVDTMTDHNRMCRKVWIIFVTWCSWTILTIVVSIFGASNFYDYATWIAIVIFTVGAISCLGWTIIFLTVTCCMWIDFS